MGLLILQWNAHSLTANGQELKQYITTCPAKPHVICVQETWLTSNFDFLIPGYNVLRQDRPGNIRAGGCAFFIHATVSYRDIGITSLLECGAVEIFFPNHTISVVNLYHSGPHFHLKDLQNILNQITSPVVFCGDFNAHNPLWGSERLDAKGRVIDSLLEASDLVLLNDYTGTRINPNGKLTSIDLTMVSYDLATKCTWQVLTDSLGSDHLPIQISFFESPKEMDISNCPRLNFKRANWKQFSTLCSLSVNESIISEDVDDFNTVLSENIINAANASMPSTTFKRKNCVPWWNGDCSAAKSKRQKAYNIVRRTSHPTDYIEYKKECAIVKRVTKQAKRTY